VREEEMDAGEASLFRVLKKVRGEASEDPDGSGVELEGLDDWAEVEEEFEVFELELDERTLRHKFLAPFDASSPRSTAFALVGQSGKETVPA